MLPKSRLLFHIALVPLYISIAIYLNLAPISFSDNLSSLLRLARANLRAQYLKTTATTRNLSSESVVDMSPMKFVARRSEERGHADHDWLKTFHTFSFAMYQDRQHELFGPLRVINEDRVAPRTGFGTHSHREFEIFSYVVSGELEHKDSMGNTEVLKRGDLQMTSAGTGISHSEKAHGSKQVHFLQIWSLPSKARLQPKYFTRHFSDADKTDKWATVVAPVGAQGVLAEREAQGPAPVNSPLTLYATILGVGKTLDRPLEGKKGYIHVIQRSGYKEGKAEGASVRISSPGSDAELTLREGDGAYIFVGKKGASLTVENDGDRAAEILVFDLD
ncbi:Putative quercetin 2,3-dioxygenase [Psilocybe cubensis]|uniref:Quercetin 2,3-dioxygenase n=2 Tax=Psilocybe cubensis TaxID=181762 RepID=A0ACB8GW40_PSICU|nr:Putative quercetin 2,3-dioxygenase [Psilocybe cubensis]KAH9479841.1 Putative quercetin 2,3-dioxygenase [Psilocybe cubensis]